MRRGANVSSSRLLRLGARMHRSYSSMAQGTMYNWRVKAVNDALCSQGKAEGMLQIEDLVALGHLDQYHYLGVAACDEAAEVLGLGPGSNVLDLGSGIGGPARYLAATTGCSVMGVELQSELCEAATALTARVEGLAERVKFVAGDAVAIDSPLPAPFEATSFDHYLSQLVNLHVPDRAALLATAFGQLREGGTFYIEDFCQLAPLLPDDASTLADLVHAPSVSSVDAYVADLEAAGFVDIEAVDMSGPWTKWNRARADGYAATKADAVALHGEDIFASRQRFYSAVAGLFDGGSIGGVRLTGRKPGRHERRLHAARRSAATKKGTTAAGTVRILENGHGFNSDHAADTSPLASPPHAQLITGAATSQPPLPWTTEREGDGVHDSLQYHFFLSGIFVAMYAPARARIPRACA